MIKRDPYESSEHRGGWPLLARLQSPRGTDPSQGEWSSSTIERISLPRARLPPASHRNPGAGPAPRLLPLPLNLRQTRAPYSLMMAPLVPRMPRGPSVLSRHRNTSAVSRARPPAGAPPFSCTHRCIARLGALHAARRSPAQLAPRHRGGPAKGAQMGGPGGGGAGACSARH